MKSFLLSVLLVCAFGVQAQRSISATNQAYAQQAQALREVQMALQRLESRLDAIEQQQSALSGRISTLERGNGAASKDDIAALRADLNAVKAQQAEMRGEIVSDLSKRMAQVQAKQAAALQAQQAAQKSGYEHVVEAGQTISEIARAYKVSTQSILKANKISDPTKIRVGQKLFIPDP